MYALINAFLWTFLVTLLVLAIVRPLLFVYGRRAKGRSLQQFP